MNRMLNKLSNFVLGNGFYIALTLCVTMIVVSAVYLLNVVTPEISTPASGTAEIVVPESTVIPQLEQPILKPIDPPEPTPMTEPKASETPESTEETEDVDVEPELPVEVMEPVALFSEFVWPTLGVVTQEHSVEVLSYNETMGDWRIHNGIDISAPLGTEVFAAWEGHVSAVFSDDLMGHTVVISHPQGLETTYSNLMGEPLPTVGQALRTGQSFAVVGQSAIAESAKDPHLQFSVSNNGVEENPLDFLPVMGKDTAEEGLEDGLEDLAEDGIVDGLEDEIQSSHTVVFD